MSYEVFSSITHRYLTINNDDIEASFHDIITAKDRGFLDKNDVEAARTAVFVFYHRGVSKFGFINPEIKNMIRRFIVDAYSPVEMGNTLDEAFKLMNIPKNITPVDMKRFLDEHCPGGGGFKLQNQLDRLKEDTDAKNIVSFLTEKWKENVEIAYLKRNNWRGKGLLLLLTHPLLSKMIIDKQFVSNVVWAGNYNRLYDVLSFLLEIKGFAECHMNEKNVVNGILRLSGCRELPVVLRDLTYADLFKSENALKNLEMILSLSSEDLTTLSRRVSSVLVSETVKENQTNFENYFKGKITIVNTSFVSLMNPPVFSRVFCQAKDNLPHSQYDLVPEIGHAC